MRILVCGDRNWTDANFIESNISNVLQSGYEYMEDAFQFSILIQGEASGADTIAKKYALKNKMLYLDFPAEWDKYGKSAGPIRNKQMIDEGKPDIVLAFYNDISKSKGTLDMIKQANKAGIEVRLYSNI